VRNLEEKGGEEENLFLKGEKQPLAQSKKKNQETKTFDWGQGTYPRQVKGIFCV